MGYLTRYKLDVQPVSDETLREIKRTMVHLAHKYEDACYGFLWMEGFYEANLSVDVDSATLANIPSPPWKNEEPMKWYDHEEGVKLLSEEFPDILFILDGEGEESGDLWRKFFFGGECHRANTTIRFSTFPLDKALPLSEGRAWAEDVIYGRAKCPENAAHARTMALWMVKNRLHNEDDLMTVVRSLVDRGHYEVARSTFDAWIDHKEKDLG